MGVDLIVCSQCGNTAERHQPGRSLCRNCGREHKRAYRARNAQKVNETHLAWARKNPERRMWSDAKRRAKKDGRDFTIEISDIVVPRFCPVLGIELKRNTNGVSGGASPSIDRIDSSRGYEKGNVAVISNRANTIKSNATAGELMKVALYCENGL